MSSKIGRFFRKVVDNYKNSTPAGKVAKAALAFGIPGGLFALGMNRNKQAAEKIENLTPAEREALIMGPAFGEKRDWATGMWSLFGFGHKAKKVDENGYEA